MKIKKVLAGVGSLLLVYGFFVVVSFSYVEDPYYNILGVLAYAFLSLLGVVAIVVFTVLAIALFLYAVGVFD